MQMAYSGAISNTADFEVVNLMLTFTKKIKKNWGGGSKKARLFPHKTSSPVMHLNPLLHWQEVAIAHIMFDYQSTILVSENEISNLKWAGGSVSRQGLCFMTEEDNKLHLSSEKGCQTGPDLSALENECQVNKTTGVTCTEQVTKGLYDSPFLIIIFYKAPQFLQTYIIRPARPCTT